MSKYKISVSLDEKNFFWIVVDRQKFIRNPSEEDLKDAKNYLNGKSPIFYNKTNICPRCREEYERDGKKLTDNSILYPGNEKREMNKVGGWTGKWVCSSCHEKYDPNSVRNIIKSLRDRRMGSLDPNSSVAKGDNSQELACELYGWKDLNKENDNYAIGTPIDCYDPKTELYHQVQGRYYNSRNGQWPFGYHEREREKIYEDMICFCYSKDGKIIERIYIFPKKEIMRITGITICKIRHSSQYPWYEQYRVTDEDKLKKANEIWIEILMRNKIIGA